jgi:kumamolisin
MSTPSLSCSVLRILTGPLVDSFRILLQSFDVESHTSTLIPVSGSSRDPLSTAEPIGDSDPTQRIEVIVRVRSRAGLNWQKHLRDLESQLLRDRVYISREELSAKMGADPQDLASVESFAHEHRLTALETSVPKRTVRLSGTVVDFQNAFGVELKTYTSKEATYRGRTGAVYVPRQIAHIVEGVFGLDNRPVSVRLNGLAAAAAAKPSRPSQDQRFTVAELKQAYNFPRNLDGTGQCLALIELNSIDAQGNVTGAGYELSDLKAYFAKIGIAMPSISAVGVSGGINKPGSDMTGDLETTLDIEVAGAAAPGAKIAVYFAPNTTAGFIDAVSAAVHDVLRMPTVLSISWGMSEEKATGQFLKVMDQLLQDAAALGVTVCCEAGDHGSPDAVAQLRDGAAHVEFPASSPFALACGGTKLETVGGKIKSEIVWNEGDKVSGATGGGISNQFPLPKYQQGLTYGTPSQPLTHRGVPDVGANALGYTGFVHGKVFHLFGTSAATPLWASLIAIINQGLQANKQKPVGLLNPLIYTQPDVKNTFRDITEGNNDVDGTLHKYSAAHGWDPCTGLGSPDGTSLLDALKQESQPKRMRRTGHK